ncbi:MAG: bifunctional oligoribonuclease/PAP phosphatase NrnA [Flavobacteriia bacterium]|nr:bifunctional oligoribonuclease/PAP phosphatase NrnA [Flavobacteriia bacterium]
MELNDLREFLAGSRNIVITNHINPDGDAMGSALGLQHFLKGRGHDVRVVAPNEPPPFLRWLPGYNDVIMADVQSDLAKSAFDDADVIFVLDYNAIHRGGDLIQSWIQASKARKVMIDHHREPDTWPDDIYSDTAKGSTAEMVFDLIQWWDGDGELTTDIANSLYVGIVTDSGSFRFPSTTPATHRAAARLLEAGAEPSNIHDKVYDVNTRSRLKLLGVMLDNMEVLEDKGIAILHLTAPIMQQCNYTKGDSEGFVNYGLSLKGMRVSVFFREDGDRTKCSFRSKGDVDVNTFARNHFNGGGHLNAAGGIFEGNAEEAIQHFKKALESDSL